LRATYWKCLEWIDAEKDLQFFVGRMARHSTTWYLLWKGLGFAQDAADIGRVDMGTMKRIVDSLLTVPWNERSLLPFIAIHSSFRGWNLFDTFFVEHSEV
jgi:hypothetical protein